MSMFHLYTSGFGTLMAMKQRSVHLGFLVLLTFLLYPGSKRSPRSRPSIIDWVWLALSLSSSLYIFFAFDAFSIRGTAITPDYVMGTILIVCILEATRRTVGKELMILSLIFLAYGYWGEYIPGVLGHTGFSFRRIVYQLFLSSEGLFGISLGVSSTYIFLFILFGAFLTETGMGRFIKDLAMSLAGRTIGGEAKVSIVASGLMGMINGSAVGNVAATGTFTIPLMTGAGFKPVFSAAVVAVVCTGRSCLPSWARLHSLWPSSGSITIMLAAAILAVLYYLAEYAVIHIEAVKLGMKPIPREGDHSPYQGHAGERAPSCSNHCYRLSSADRSDPLYAAFYGSFSPLP